MKIQIWKFEFLKIWKFENSNFKIWKFKFENSNLKTRHCRNQRTAQTIHKEHRNANQNDKRTKCSTQTANPTNHSHATTNYKRAKQKIKTDTLKIAAWNSNGLQQRALETKTFIYVNCLRVQVRINKGTFSV